MSKSKNSSRKSSTPEARRTTESENEKEYDFLKTIYETKLKDRQYLDDKALTLIQTNGILLVILSALFGNILPNRMELSIWIQVLIFIMVIFYFASAIFATYAIYPRKMHRKEVASDRATSYYEERLRELTKNYEKNVLPLKARWLSFGLTCFALGVGILVIVVICFIFGILLPPIDP